MPVTMEIMIVLWRWRSKAQDDDGHMMSHIMIACDVYLLYILFLLGSALLLDEAARTNITRTLTRDRFSRRALHIGGLRVTVSPTLVESNLTTTGPC